MGETGPRDGAGRQQQTLHGAVTGLSSVHMLGFARALEVVITAKTERIDLRVPELPKSQVSEVAALSGMTLLAFIAALARDRAEKIICKRELLRLSDVDRDRFLEAQDCPARVTSASIRRAKERYKTWVA